jgi:membrane-associated phospholipid phosphatase
VLATIYFGWHYIVDDIAGLAIGGAAVLLAALGTGRFRSSPVPVPQEEAVRPGAGWSRLTPARFRRRPEASPSTS